MQVSGSLEHGLVLGSGVSRLDDRLHGVGVADWVQTSLRLLAGKRLGARLHHVVVLHAVLALDRISELLSCLLELFLRGRRWNGVWLSATCLVEKRSTHTDSSLVFDLDVDWSRLALSVVGSVHCVVHHASLVDLSSLHEWSVASRSCAVSSVKGVAVSVGGTAISVLDDAAANDSQST